jgi:hypothetical protein
MKASWVLLLQKPITIHACRIGVRLELGSSLSIPHFGEEQALSSNQNDSSPQTANVNLHFRGQAESDWGEDMFLNVDTDNCSTASSEDPFNDNKLCSKRTCGLPQRSHRLGLKAGL